MSNLALQRIREAKEQRLTRLDIGNCGLTEIPDEVFELTWLEELILSGQWWEYSFEEKKWEDFNSRNKGIANTIKFISPKIKILRYLKVLIANEQTAIRDLNPLKELTDLQQLVINDTAISR
jgi:internalin A